MLFISTWCRVQVNGGDAGHEGQCLRIGDREVKIVIFYTGGLREGMVVLNFLIAIMMVHGVLQRNRARTYSSVHFPLYWIMSGFFFVVVVFSSDGCSVCCHSDFCKILFKVSLTFKIPRESIWPPEDHFHVLHKNHQHHSSEIL